MVGSETKKLQEAAVFRYAELTETEAKSLLIEGKWIDALTAAVSDVVASTAVALGERVIVLDDRYGLTLGEIKNDLDRLSANAATSLAALGVSS